MKVSQDLRESTVSEAKYRGLLEAAPDAMVVVNQGGEIVLVNVQAEKQFGYRRDELVGQKVTNIIPEGFAERLIADASRSAADALAQQIGTGIELSGRRKDGSQFPIEIMLSPLESFEGILVTAAIRNITVRKDAEKHLAQMEGRRKHTENALRESEERYRMLLDGIPDYAIFMMDARGQVLSWNAGAERLKGYKPDQIIGQNFSCFFPPEDIKHGRPEEVLRMTAAAGRHEEQSVRVRKDGSRFLASLSFTALRDAEGNLRGFSEFGHDLTESTESGAKYRGLLEAAPDAMVVVNQGGEIVLLNVQAEKQFGYRRDELVGQKVKNIIPEGFAERLIADGTRSAADALAQQIGTGIELSGRRKDGSLFPIEIMLSPLQSAEGILVTAAIRNITVRKDAEEHLAQMEGRYRGLLEAAPDAMVVVNQRGEIVLLNVQAEKQFGYRRDELVGQKVKNIIPEGFAERLIADGTRSAAEALAQQIGTGIELSGRRKDGSQFPIEIMLSPLDSAEGILVTAAIRNITVRKDAEKHLAQMEGRYRGLLEAAPDAMVVVNQGGEIVLLNVQAEKQFGYRRDELVGQKVKNIIPEGFAERLISDGTRSAADALAQQIGTGIELSGRRKDGSQFPIEIMLSPLESAEGILVTAAIRNITVRKDAEEHLAQMEGRYRGLLEAAPDAMVVVNQGGEIVLLNVQAEKQFGYRRDELVGKKVKSIIPEGFAERLIADGTRSAAEALAQQIGTGIELSGQRKDGSQFPIEIMLSPLESAEGILVTAAIRNITVRKESEEHSAKLEDQAVSLQRKRDELELRVGERTKELAVAVQVLERSNLELKQFAYVASHDLQSPLRSISGFVQLLKMEYEGKLDEQAQDWIRRTVQSIAKMQTLIRDLLSYSRVDARSRPFAQTPFLDIVNDALALLESSIHDSGAQVTVGELPAIMCDRSQMVQLIQNLIGNGLTYHGDKPPDIHISAERSAKEWIFSVRDNGIGIDPNHYEQIFEIFKRLHDQTEYPGTGIGLAVCRRVVERHGGRIWVKSDPGQGSTFYFTIPEGTEQSHAQ